MMLAEKTQNTKLHLQYDYNCTNHVGQDWKKLWSNDNSLIFGGNGMRDNFFFFYHHCVNVSTIMQNGKYQLMLIATICSYMSNTV